MTEKKHWIRVALHDLCQPLTALECRLYLGTLEVEDAHEGAIVSPENLRLRDTLGDALAECERMMALVRGMQERLNNKEQA
jgi:hypothetical protein